MRGGLAVLLMLALPSSARADGYDRIVSRMLAAAKSFHPRRVAVLEFPYRDERAGEGPRAVQESLVMRLAAPEAYGPGPAGP